MYMQAHLHVLLQESLALYCTPHNARAVTSSVKSSQPRGSRHPLEPPPPPPQTASPAQNPFRHPLEKEMATHSSILAWRTPGTEEPSGLLSMGSHRVGHD